MSIPGNDIFDGDVSPQLTSYEDAMKDVVEAASDFPQGQVDDVAQEASEEPSPLTIAVERHMTNVVRERSCLRTGSKHGVPQEDAIEILSRNLEEYNRIGEGNQDALAGTLDTPEGRAWAENVILGSFNLPTGGAFNQALHREDSEWGQYALHGNEKLGPAKPRYAAPDKGGVVKGDRALFALRQSLSLGSDIQVPLWRSGIWVTLKATSLADFHHAHQRVAERKISLGRETGGLVYSNSQVYLAEAWIEMVLEHCQTSSLRDHSVENLKKTILVPDLQQLLWGMAVALWPNGYPFDLPCLDNPEHCQHVERDVLNLSALMWVDRKALTADQKKHMARRNAKFTDEEIQAYRQAHRTSSKNRITVSTEGGDTTFVLEAPSLEAYIDSGHQWIESIVAATDESMKLTDENAGSRDRFISSQARLSAIRQYGSWFKEVLIGTLDDPDNPPLVVVDPDTLHDAMEMISQDEINFPSVINGIGSFIDDVAISVIAIPRFNCTVCGKDQKIENTDDPHPYLIPLDAMKIFFTLLARRTSRILKASTL